MPLEYKIKYLKNKFRRIKTQNTIIFWVWNYNLWVKQMFLHYQNGNTWVQQKNQMNIEQKISKYFIFH